MNTDIFYQTPLFHNIVRDMIEKPEILRVLNENSDSLLILDSPHSGTTYPEDFNYSCEFFDLEKSEDKYVDEIFIKIENLGVPFLYALFPRTYIDVNRSENDIDPLLHNQEWIDEPVKAEPTSRSDAGIGLVHRLTRSGHPIYDRFLPKEEILNRISNYYRYYYQTLETLLNNSYDKHSAVYHLDCHSFPNIITQTDRFNPQNTPDFVLGNRNGNSSSSEFINLIRCFLENKGHNVAVNTPYAGLELVERFSNPVQNRHSVQIEINRKLYMNEETLEKTKNFAKLQSDMTDLVAYLLENIE